MDTKVDETTDTAQAAIVALLEKALERARAGELVQLALTALDRNGDGYVGYGGEMAAESDFVELFRDAADAVEREVRGQLPTVRISPVKPS